MGPLVVVELDPVANDTAGTWQGLEVVAVDAMLLQRADYPIDQPILLRRAGHDELLLQAIALDKCCIAATGAAEWERADYAAPGGRTGDP